MKNSEMNLMTEDDFMECSNLSEWIKLAASKFDVNAANSDTICDCYYSFKDFFNDIDD